MHIVVVGGGTAGHVIPALPIIRLLQADGCKVSFIGTRSGLERSLVADAGVAFYGISAGKLRRYWSWQNFTDVFRILRGVMQSVVLIGRLRPDGIFSKGGFVSFPVALAGWLWRVPLVVHESDYTPGLANRLVLPFASVVCTSFAQTAEFLRGRRVVHTGTPLRPELMAGDAAAGRAALCIGPDRPLLIVTGGSLGAADLNAALADALDALTEKYYVLHICGRGKRLARELPNYDQREYVDAGWGDLLAAADVVVSRAGANALFELLALRKLTVLVPLDAQSSRGDQLQNAAFAQQQGLSHVIAPEALSGQALMDAIAAVERNRARYQQALDAYTAPDAARAITDQILKLA